MGADPVQLGLVTSLGRPGGNITGATLLSSDQIQKRLQLLHDVVPTAKLFGLLQNPDNSGRNSSSGRTMLELAQDAARSLGVTIEVASVRTVGEFGAAFASLREKRIDALATSSDALFYSGRERLVALALDHEKLKPAFEFAEFITSSSSEELPAAALRSPDALFCVFPLAAVWISNPS